MAKVIIDNKEYDFESLPKEAQQMIQNIQYVEAKLNDIKNEQALLNAAKAYYTEQLSKLLPKK